MGADMIRAFFHRRRLLKLAMRRADKKAGNNSAATVKNYLTVHQTLARGR
jgi:hypothetical protein